MKSSQPISKIEGAQQQLDTAIDLYFDNADSVSVYTLAFASFKVLFDLYPHHRGDDFATQLDHLISKEGWKSMSGVANFLKHADRDPNAFLQPNKLLQGGSIIGLATLLFRRMNGEFSRKMMAFDYWMEEEGYDDLGIEEIDHNVKRAAQFKVIRDRIRALPQEEKMRVAREVYRGFLDSYDEITEMVADTKAKGMTLTELLDRELHPKASEPK